MYKGDLNRAPSWATHYVERKLTGSSSFWFVNPDTGRWTDVGAYSEFFSPNKKRVAFLLTDDEFRVVELLPKSLENK